MKQPPEQQKFTSLAAAARATGKSRTTIQRSIKSGKLSAPKDEDGNYSIDPAELNRVFPLKGSVTGEAHGAGVHGTLRNSDETGAEHPEIRVLQAELKASQQMAEERGKTIDDLRGRLDKSENERTAAQTKLTALLSAPREKAPQEATQRRWWPLLVVVVLLLAIALAVALLRPETVTAMLLTIAG